MLKIVLALLVVAVAGLLVAAAFQPDEFRVTRSTLIDAPASAIFPHINDVKKTQVWSPWVAMEPDAKYEFEGPAAGKGAIVRWEGKKVGTGASTIVESRPNSFVQTRLDFVKPMKSTSTAEISIEPENGQSRVSWTMYGPNTYLTKLMGLIMNCEKMIGGDFEKGLASLKDIAEK